MQKYLPSKKFLYLLGSIVLAILIIWGGKILVEQQTKNTQKLAVEKIAAENKKTASIKEFMAIDSDGDGLKDWEEALWKADPKKSDTDGDGTNDGAEVKDNRDPLKPNVAKLGERPSDQAEESVITENQRVLDDFNKLSDTDKFARTFFSEYYAAKNGDFNNKLSATNKEILIQSSAYSVGDPAIVQYSLTDIKTFTSTSTADIKTYGNKIGAISILNTPKNSTYELTTLNKALTTDDEKILADLDPVIDGYKKIIAGYLATPAPKEIAQLHLDLINDMQKVETSIEKMKDLFTDPIPAINALKIYKETVPKMAQDFANLKLYFNRKGIIFGPTEYGYKFLNVI